MKLPVTIQALLVWGAAIAMLVVAICATGCAGQAPAATPAFDVTTPVAPDIAPEAPDITADTEPPAKCCANPNCPCDVCSGDCPCGMLAPNQRAALLGENKALKDELQLARAEAYATVRVNGDWYCTKNGQTLRYEAVRCYGPDRPCDYEWRPVSEIPKPQASVLRPRAAPSCESGNCGRSTRRGIFRW